MTDQDWSTPSRRWERRYGSLSVEQISPGAPFVGYVGFTEVGSFKTLKAAKAAVDNEARRIVELAERNHATICEALAKVAP